MGVPHAHSLSQKPRRVPPPGGGGKSKIVFPAACTSEKPLARSERRIVRQRRTTEAQSAARPPWRKRRQPFSTVYARPSARRDRMPGSPARRSSRRDTTASAVNTSSQHRPQRTLDRRQRRPGQQPPGQGEGQADPALKIARQAAVVPEPHPQQPVVQEMHPVLHRRGGEAAPQGQGPEPVRQGRGQGQHRQGPQPVHRAQGQQQKALSGRLGRPGGGGVAPLQQIAEKAVGPERPEQQRQSAPPSFPETSLSGGGAIIPRCGAEDFVV